MKWLFNTNRKEQKTQNELERQQNAEKQLDVYRQKKADQLKKYEEHRQKTIAVGVETLCSTEMTISKKNELFNEIIDILKDNPSDSINNSLFEISKQAYEYQIANFTDNTKLNETIKIRYEQFKQLESNDDIEEFGITDLITFSDLQTQILDNPVKVKATVYSTNEDGVFDFQITGTKYAEPEAWEILKSLERYEELSLIAEPDNPYDESAIAIYHNDIKLGYIPKAVVSEMQSFPSTPDLDYNCVFKKASDHEIPFAWVYCSLEQ